MGVKDSVCKEYFSVPKRFADMCNVMLFGGKAIVRPEDLYEANTEYAYISRNSKHYNKSIVDISRRWKRNNATIALIIQENQAYTNYAMVLRNMLSESLIYNKQLKDYEREHDEKRDLAGDEYLSGISKSDKFVPVITIVIYLGERKWDGAVRLTEMLDMDDSLSPFISDYRINLYDYHNYESSDEFSTDISVMFKALSARRDKDKLVNTFSGDNGNISPDTMRFIGAMLDTKNIDKYIEKNEDGEEIERMCKAVEDLREDGRKQGKLEQILDTIIKKVDKNKTLAQIADEIEEETEFIRPMYDAVIANPGKTTDEIYKIMYQEGEVTVV